MQLLVLLLALLLMLPGPQLHVSAPSAKPVQHFFAAVALLRRNDNDHSPITLSPH